MTMNQSKPHWNSYIQFIVQAVILIMIAVLLGYIYIQDGRLKELEKRMATMSVTVGGKKLVVIKTEQTLLKRKEELEAINSRLEMVENKVNDLLIQHEDSLSDNDNTSKQLDQMGAKSQSMNQGFGNMERYLENIREELENTDQMLQQLKDKLADVYNEKKSASSSQQIFQTRLVENAAEIQTDTKTLNRREANLKHHAEKIVEMKSIQNNSVNIVGEINREIHEPIGSNKDLLNEHSKAIKIEKGRIKNTEQHATASDSCQTGIVAMDQPISTDEERLLKVQFGTPFSSLPVISYGIMKLDTNAPSNPRIWVTLKDQSTTGFTASFTTWLGSIVYECAISWMACARS